MTQQLDENDITYHVLDGHTLVYSTGHNDMHQVLARKHNSHHNLHDILHQYSHEMKPATKKDFDNFRVDSKGHIKESEQLDEKITKYTSFSKFKKHSNAVEKYVNSPEGFKLKSHQRTIGKWNYDTESGHVNDPRTKGHIKESIMENEIILNILNKNYVDVQENIYDSLAEKANNIMDSYKEQLAVDYFNTNVNENLGVVSTVKKKLDATEKNNKRTSWSPNQWKKWLKDNPDKRRVNPQPKEHSLET